MYHDFTEMPVWQKGMQIVRLSYVLVELLPKYEQYAMCSQIRNAALSIPGNIAEGFGRHHSRDKFNFYYYSRGSSFELRSHLIAATEVNYLSIKDVSAVLEICLEVEKELNFIINSMKG